MSKAAQEGWLGKNQLPPKIPPFKTPRQLKMKNTGKASVREEIVDVSESDRQDVVDVTETEQKDSDSEDETQFGVIYERFVPGVDATTEQTFSTDV
jgi:hypothetical protein